MGHDKALLELDGKSLLARALELAAAVSANVFIVGPKERFVPHTRVIEDIFPEQGPLAGIHSALSHSQSELNLVLAVDTPFMLAEFLRYLLEQARGTRAVVTVPHANGAWQPLCAVYRPAFRPLAEQALKARRNKIDPLFAATTIRAIDEEEIKRLAFDLRMFDNLNTPAEWQRALRRG